MKTLALAILIAATEAVSTDRQTVYDLYNDCLKQPNADVAYCYNTYLRGRTFVREPESEDEMKNVVFEADEPTGRVIHDRGVETYRKTFGTVFADATVDFFKTDKRSSGVGPELGPRQTVVPEDKTSHNYAEPQTCTDPCAEMKMKVAELQNQLEFLEWRNEQAEQLYATIAYRFNVGVIPYY